MHRRSVSRASYSLSVFTTTIFRGARRVLSLATTHSKSEDEAWPPPTKVVDPITGKVRMYHRGEIVEAPDAAEAERLEKAAVWDLRHIAERIRATLSS